MPSLSDKLKSLGVKVGTANLAPKRQADPPVDLILGGSYVSTSRGDAFVAEQSFSREYSHGENASLFSFLFSESASLSLLAEWAGDPRLAALPLSKFAFLDVETSSLSGGSGSFAFLVGVGRFANGRFLLRQFFLRDPSEEAAMLETLIEFLAPCEALVTFNGKAFDAPLLNVRYKLHRIPSPFQGYAHLDLLPLARRLWRDRLPSRALKYLEEHILQFTRSSEEVPGYEVPYLYFDYLRTRDPRPLTGVFYHNAMDVVAMAALLNHIGELLANPFDGRELHGLDWIALGKLFEDLKRPDEAARMYERGLETELSKADFETAARRLSALQRRRGNLEQALKWWSESARRGHVYACVELAKYYEHRRRDFTSALKWTNAARKRAQEMDAPVYIREHWLAEIEHRLQRLERKVGL